MTPYNYYTRESNNNCPESSLSGSEVTAGFGIANLLISGVVSSENRGTDSSNVSTNENQDVMGD